MRYRLLRVQKSPVLPNSVAAEATPPADPFAADWRVLLPADAGDTFSSLLLLGGSPALADHLVEIGLTRHVTLDLACQGAVDAVVLLSGAKASPADVVRCMRPGALLYWEPAPPRRERSGRVEELLRGCGFAGVTAYRAHPALEKCDAYLPLAARNAERWYFRVQQPRRGFRLRLLRRFLLQILGGGPVLPSPACHAVVAVRGEERSTPVSRGILGRLPVHLLASATQLLVVKRRGRGERDRRLIVFAFSSSDPEPVGVLKVARTPRHRNRIEAEQSALVAIRRLLDPELKASLPEPLGCFGQGASVIGVESYLGGKRRGRGLRERRRQFDLTVSWIAEFHRQAEVSRRPWGPAEIARWIEKPVADYGREGRVGEREGRMLDVLLTLGRDLREESFPLVWRHGDFNESNILFAGRSVRVLDWEAAEVGLPLFDLLFFATSWSYRTEGLTEPAARVARFRELIIERRARDEISRIVWNAIEDYLAKLGIDRRFVPLLLALHWISRGSAEHVRVLAEGFDRLSCDNTGERR